MSDNITPSGYIYGREPKQTNPFWDIGKPGEATEYVEFLNTSQIDTVKDNVNCTNYIINYLNHDKEEEIFNIYVPLFSEYYTKSEIDNKDFATNSSLGNYYTKAEIDDKNYLVQADLNNYYTKSEIDNKDFATNSSLGNYYTKAEIDDKNYLVQADLNNYYTKSEIDNKNFATISYLAGHYYSKGYIMQYYYTISQTDKIFAAKADLNNYYTKTETENLINSICDQKIDEKIGGIINGQY